MFGVKQLVAIAVTKIAAYVDSQDGKIVSFTPSQINDYLDGLKGCNHKIIIIQNGTSFIISLKNKDHV